MATLEGQLQALENSDPAMDAERSFRARDYRLVGVAGSALCLLGIDRREIDTSEFELKVVSFTTENLSDHELHPRLGPVAHAYPENHNRHWAKLTQTIGSPKWPRRKVANS